MSNFLLIFILGLIVSGNVFFMGWLFHSWQVERRQFRHVSRQLLGNARITRRHVLKTLPGDSVPAAYSLEELEKTEADEDATSRVSNAPNGFANGR